MNSSSTITKLAEALKAAQSEMKNPAFDAKNPHFGSKYASLAAVREAVLPVLNKHGLALTQFPKYAAEYAGCVSRLMHTSGEWLEEECLLPVGKATAHAAGSCITYARRYSMQGIAGVVAEDDDDGNVASNSKPQLSNKSVPQDEWDNLPPDFQTWLGDLAQNVKNEISIKGGAAGLKLLEDENLSAEHRVAIWSRFDSKERSAMKPPVSKKAA